MHDPTDTSTDTSPGPDTEPPAWIKRAAQIYAQSLADCARMTPREQAEAAWSPSSRYSVDELEQMITARRAGAVTPASTPATRKAAS